VRFVAYRKGFRQLRNSPEVVAMLESHAQEIAEKAGEGMEVKPTETGGERARVAVVTQSFEARHREATQRALTRALRG
jgi:hypothetical protein